MKTWIRAGLWLTLAIVLSLSLTTDSVAWNGRITHTLYDGGPDLTTEMGIELADIMATMPYMPGLSEAVIDGQKFRPAFGPVAWRMLLAPNSIKILFIGQDATHIAEAAGRPATASFGGTAQGLAKYMGVNESAAFINTYTMTIKGQYAAYNTPYVYKGREGDEIRTTGYVDNELWLISQDPDSPIMKWRNRLIDWIMRNNRESLRMVVLFGGAARDAAGAFIESVGGQIDTKVTESQMNRIQVPETKLVFAGGNNEFPILLTKDGRDLYSEVLGRRLDYKKAADQKAALDLLKERPDELLSKMVFTRGGPYQNGALHPGQLGGYDIRSMKINGKKTISLKGIELSDGKTFSNDVLVLQLPHPTALSSPGGNPSQTVAKGLEIVRPYMEKGWTIEADEGEVNQFEAGVPYKYKKSDIDPIYYDFGTPGTRMLPVSLASRMSGNPHVIVFGTRERVKFDMGAIKAMTDAQPATPFSDEEMFIMRPRTEELRYAFDPGPGDDYARIMIDNLDVDELFSTKRGKSWKEHGISAYSVRNHPDVGVFGHYRGTFQKPRVLILADPDGFDDMLTSRALTGSRGQYLHGLMEDIGVGAEYLVIKTVPVGMDGATGADWATTLRRTKKYRDELIGTILANNDVDMIITDGRYAAEEMARMVEELEIEAPAINIARRGQANNSGIKAAAAEIAKVDGYRGVRVTGKSANIPREHMSYYSRVWEGTSGDRVIAADDDFNGLAYAVVAPKWAWTQRVKLSREERQDMKILIDKLKNNGLPMPGERIADFLRRMPIRGDNVVPLFHQIEGRELQGCDPLILAM